MGDQYHAAPLENDMFVWHFTIRGAEGTDFEGGIYHGKILLPAEYPFKPPNIMFVTPNGRFEPGTKVCLSFSAYHPELWQPAWGIRLILEALISFLPTPADGAIGALDWTKKERQRLARKSVGYCCLKCGPVSRLLAEKCDDAEFSPKFKDEIEKLHMHQVTNEAAKRKKNTTGEEQNVNASCVKNEMESEEPSARNERNLEEHNASQNEEKIEVNEPPSVPDRHLMNDAQVRRPEENLASPWLSDALVHGSIVTFTLIIYFLYNKLHSVLDELRDLDEY